MRAIARFLQRVGVLGLGILSIWLIVYVFELTDHEVPTLLALGVTYGIAAYVILPRAVRMGLKLLQRKHVPRFTVTGDGLVGDPDQSRARGHVGPTSRRLRRGRLGRSGTAESQDVVAYGSGLRSEQALPNGTLQYALPIWTRTGHRLPEGHRR